MDTILPIPEEYFEKLYQDLSLKDWQNFFQERSQFKDFLKGFRPHKIPAKLLQPIALKLLKENMDFRKEALPFWKSLLEQKVSLEIYTPKHIRENLERYSSFLGVEKFFWLCLCDPREEVQGLSQRLLQERDEASPDLSEEEDREAISLDEIQKLEEKMSASFKKTMEEKFGEIEKKMKDLSHSQVFIKEEKALLKKKLQGKTEENARLEEERGALETQLKDREQELEELRRENKKLHKTLPQDFVPCSVVLSLEKKLQRMEEALSLMNELRYEIESLKAQAEKQKRTHAETLQKLRKSRDKTRILSEDLEYYKKLYQEHTKSVQEKKQKPSQISDRDPSGKIIWLSDAHHYPKRLGNFLEKVARIPYVEEINILEFENSPHSRIKSIDSQGNVLLLFSDGQKAAKIFVKTTGANYREGLYIEEEIMETEDFFS